MLFSVTFVIKIEISVALFMVEMIIRVILMDTKNLHNCLQMLIDLCFRDVKVKKTLMKSFYIFVKQQVSIWPYHHYHIYFSLNKCDFIGRVV